MRKYVKPIAIVNSNVAEGVYAASGTGGNGVTISASSMTITINQADGYGEAYFLLNMAGQKPNNFKVKIIYNTEITDSWGDGANKEVGSNYVILAWYAAPDTVKVTVHVSNGMISELAVQSIEIV